MQATDLAKLRLGGVLTGAPCQVEAKPVVKTERIQLLCIQHPLPALWHAQEPLLVINFDCILVDLVPLLCTTIQSLMITSPHGR